MNVGALLRCAVIRAVAFTAAVALTACWKEGHADDLLLPGQARSFALNDAGVSPVIRVASPAGARSLTIWVKGDLYSVYALSQLEVDGQKWIDVSDQDASAGVRSAYGDGGWGGVSADTLQNARLGSFTLVYPFSGSQAVPQELKFKVASSRSLEPVGVTVVAAASIKNPVLHLRVFRMTEEVQADEMSAAVTVANRVLGQAGIQLQVDASRVLTGTPYSRFDALELPWASPFGDFAHLVALGRSVLPGSGLAVFVVDRLPRGVRGESLGLPGPPDPQDPYFGVVVQASDDVATGIAMAHEICHILGLRHPAVRSEHGAYQTQVGLGQALETDQDNLMNFGDHLVAEQILTIRRSPLLVSE